MVFATSQFTFPPSDGSIPHSEVVDFHLKHNPNHVFTVLYDVKTSNQLDVTYEHLACAIHRTAHLLNPNASIPQGTKLGILATTDTLTYVTLLLGTMRAGLVPFPMSTRTNAEGIAHLCTQTNTRRIVVGGSPAVLELGAAVKLLLGQKEHPLEYVEVPAQQVKTAASQDFKQFPELKPTGNDSIVSVLHSSGSTGMPKPIAWHQEGVFKNVVNQSLIQMYRVPGARVGTMALPSFHTMVSSVIGGLGKTWSEDEDAMKELKRMPIVTFGGGPLAQSIGDKLADEGVHLHSGYGATEFGLAGDLFDPNKDLHDWRYVSFATHTDIIFDPQQDGETCELVLLPNSQRRPYALNSEYEGQPAYRSKDLVKKHSTKPHLWRFVGRLDDQIILLNGEKTNPGAMEVEILNCSFVQSAVMFGRERNQTGVLIELADIVKHKYEGMENRMLLVNEIWPYVEQANRISPTHSRLARDAIILVDPSLPLPRTPKGTVSRSAALKAYAKEIDDMYAALEKDSGVVTAIGTPTSWNDFVSVQEWLVKCVGNILGRDVAISGDLFQQGMDSLTASILLRTIKGTLHSSVDERIQGVAEKLKHQTIFAYPTVEQLSTLVVRLINGDSDAISANAHSSALEAIQSMIGKYDSNWGDVKRILETHPGLSKESVVVTGTTGALGSHLLAQLLDDDRVEKVWALNRGSKGMNGKQSSSFKDKLLDAELLKSTKLSLLEADLERENIGLEPRVYEEIQKSVTAIIHNAWQVNFNLALQSFEPSIKGARNLLDLAFSSTASSGPPRFLFTSSISAAGFGKPGAHLNEVYVNPEDAANGIGYGQSKFVTEKILESARTAGLETCVVRLGQLTGDTKSGSWSTTDWVPSIVGSSVSVGCLPTLTGDVSWLPLDIAARSVVDACTSRGDVMPPIIHSSHPHPVEWSRLFSIFAQTLKSRNNDTQPLPLVPFREWNQRVTTVASTFVGSESDRYRRFPSTKIQSTIEGMVQADEELQLQGTKLGAESGGTARLDTSKAEGLSEALKNAPEIGQEHVEKWVKYWEKKGLFV
ncbi:hypothetical protein FRC07_004314 [Ceratobasidium sp. 392]|nr:hypothetical protein FRC07_004314 [Ceratobasidium sp. 392]